MEINRGLNLDLLLKILHQPSAPFRERFVSLVIQEELKKLKVPYFIDKIGNIVAGVKSEQDLKAKVKQKSNEALKIFIAHMDHPGFHGNKWLSSDRFKFIFHGGSPNENLEGTRVWLADERGDAGYGTIETANVKTTKHYKAITDGVIKVEPSSRLLVQTTGKPKASSIFGGFAFRSPAWLDRQILRTKAADDLVGCFSILESFRKSSLRRGKAKKKAPNFLALFTRAEEVGFVGLLGHLELGLYKNSKRQILWISLETSRQLPQAEIGKGPILRLGDRAGTFSPRGLKIFRQEVQKRTSSGKMGTPVQTRIMDGGACEASGAISFGYEAIGISVPLGNYHNQNLEGGPDAPESGNGPAPEFIALSDLSGLLDLTALIAETPFNLEDAFLETKTAHRKNLARYKSLLKSGLW